MIQNRPQNQLLQIHFTLTGSGDVDFEAIYEEAHGGRRSQIDEIENPMAQSSTGTNASDEAGRAGTENPLMGSVKVDEGDEEEDDEDEEDNDDNDDNDDEDHCVGRCIDCCRVTALLPTRVRDDAAERRHDWQPLRFRGVNRPDCYWEAFQDLGPCRPGGFPHRATPSCRGADALP